MRRLHTAHACVTFGLCLALGVTTLHAPARAQDAAVIRRGSVFVPAPRGTGETLDKTPLPAAGAKGDLVTTLTGDKLQGTVGEVGSDGILRLSAPQYDGEVRLRLTALDQVTLQAADDEPGRDTVRLTNGDWIGGTITAITPEAVTLETVAAGRLTIRRAMTASVAFNEGTGTLLQSRFAQGEIKPWETTRGTWKIQDGALVNSTFGNQSAVIGTIDQKEPVTLEADVESLSGQNMQFGLVLFASDRENYYGRDSIVAQISSHNFNIMVCSQGNTNHVQDGMLPQRPWVKGVMRAAYDPETNKLSLWANTQPLGEWVVAQAPKTGRYILLFTQQPIKVNSLRVLPGVVRPTAPDEDKAGELHTISLGNRDRVTASDLTLAEGVLNAQTPFGAIRVPRPNLSGIQFGTKGQEQPRRRKEDIFVEVARSRITVQFGGMNAEALAGKSEALGDVTFRREAVCGLKFNIYR